MNSLAIKFDERAIDLYFSKTAFGVVLADGREISAPLEWFPKLRDANEAQRANWRIIGNGIGIHWQDLDEDVAVSSLIHGNE